jgi:branched-chain amino acid transport system substrate-binding protein
MNRLFHALSLLAATSLTVLAIGCGGGGGGSDQPSNPDIRVGALLNLSGPYSGNDQLVYLALYQAAQEAQTSLGVTVAIDALDTQGDPTIATQQLQSLLDKGIRVVVGPSTSGEAQAVLPLANAAGALLVSESSTAQTLAIPNDALYRLSPSNVIQSQAVVDLMALQGKRALITVNREDLGNQEEATSVRAFASQRRFSLQPAITYPASAWSDFDSVAQQIVAAAAKASAGGVEQVAIFIAGFDEVANLLAACSTYEPLNNYTFYGSDGTAQNTQIISSARPAYFAADADGFPSPFLSVPANQASLAQQITDAIGGTYPNGFALNGYDAILIMANAYLDDPQFTTGGTATRQAFVKAAQGYQGVTGVIQLNGAGDRITADYTFWGVCYLNGLTNWYSVGHWTPANPSSQRGTASFSGCPVE